MPTKKVVKLTNPQKLLLVIYDLANGTKKTIPYTKIVVEAYKKYKADFHLPGYPEYPDSETVSKELYRTQTKKVGLITYGNKLFSLTDKGIDVISKLKKAVQGKRIYSHKKFDKYIDKEIKRIKNLYSLKHFFDNDLDKILDTDFYGYLGVTVKTEKNIFFSRLSLMKEVVDEMKKNINKEFEILIRFHDFMVKKFKDEINYKLK